jgi:hypothetical protein
MKKLALATTTALAVALAACSSDASGSGTASFVTWGEEYVEKEIPSADVEDGWTIKYSKFLVAIHDVTVADDAGGQAAKQAGSKLVDHTKPGRKPVASFAGIPARAWNRVSYRVGPAAADSQLEGATEADKALMVQGGFSVYVEATATKGAVTKSYKWGFKTNTVYDRCQGELAGKETDGVVVTNGGTDSVELTIHGDHFYYDDLQAKEAKVRFDSIAAADDAGNKDGVVTLEELAAVKLAAIPKDKGPYGTGSAAGINDLRAFVEALSRTVGHFRGEGECFASAK